LQKATEYKPNDTQLRFDAAYSSDEGDLDALALMHYEVLLNLKPDEASALNNIGVVYDQLKLPLQQIAYYKAAVKNGNTLAAANLAYRYLEAGFADEAKEVLNTAIMVEDAHPNVIEAKAAVDRQEEAQSKRSTEALSAARQQYRFLLTFAEAYFSIPSGRPRFEGCWQLLDSVEVEITRNADRLEMKWKRNGRDHVMAGRIHNRGALITKYSRRDSHWSSSLGDKGYAYLSEDNQHLNVMTLKDGKHSFLELTLTQQHEGES
jgi:tetratricopeptide (TPR) repeat protein